jgi:DNA-binding IclR family transcriptional regulator
MKKTICGRAQTGAPALQRGLNVLEFLHTRMDGETLSMIARGLHYPVNSVRRMLNTLTHNGYTDYDSESRRYRISRKLARLALDDARDRGLLACTLDILRDLRDILKETVVVTILDGDEGLVLEQVQGLYPFRFVCHPGTRQPLHASASTKCILAFSPPTVREAALRNCRFPRMTPRTITRRAMFMRELESIRKQGYGVDRGELYPGVLCVAAPVFNARGEVVASLTVTGPDNRMPESKFPIIGQMLCAHALKASQRMGYTPSQGRVS